MGEGEMADAPRRKMIEVALPLEAINAESAREKSIRHGHPSTLHLWWARRPLAAARAVLFSQLVDDPSSREEEFRAEALDRKVPADRVEGYVEGRVAAERERLHHLLEKLVVWENSNDEDLLAQARAEILKSTGGNPPPILDPFAGGGSIPLEAQRLGLEAHASDLNPVAVLINKALIEIPPKFAGRPPVFPGLAESEIRPWRRAEGLAADVRAYGQWMRDEAEKRIGHLYPKATLPDGSKANVIAWIWARTVTCPNPACGIEMPLVRSWWLGKKKGKEAYVVPTVVADASAPSGKRVKFTIGHDPAKAPTADTDGTMSGRTGGVCVACGSAISAAAVHQQLDVREKPVSLLMAVAAEGNRRRIYAEPTSEHVAAADSVKALADSIHSHDSAVTAEARGTFGGNAQGRRYGFFTFADYFTDRQLVALTTFSDLVGGAREKVYAGGLPAGDDAPDRLEAGGTGAATYADAVATYLGMTISRSLNKSSTIASWDSSPKMEAVRSVFARQAIPMSWDFAEANPWGGSSGDFLEDVEWVAKTIDRAPAVTDASAKQSEAARTGYTGQLVSTDPPYYDNIGYSDLSDFFYVWLRRSLRSVHPKLLSTLLVPKAEELVANAYRHSGRDRAALFFEEGFTRVFAKARESALPDYPVTVFYAFKQSEQMTEGEVSTGWETLLQGMIRAGWSITATWPMRSELGNRMLSQGTNALASSIVLALRPRPDDAPQVDRRGFISALRDELPTKLRELQQGKIAPVDLPQAAIGPGMAVYSRYSRVIEGDGSAMTVRTALARINDVLDEVISEQEGDFDSDTRFAIAWFRQYGYGTGVFGDADNIARARNASIDALARSGILTSGGGKVALIRPEVLPGDYDPQADPRISHWEVVHHLVRVLDGHGVDGAATFFASIRARPDGAIDPDLCKELAFLLFRIAEDNKWAKEAVGFNALGTSWNDIVAASRTLAATPQQTTLTLEES
jgi:putative DNA methylase